MPTLNWPVVDVLLQNEAMYRKVIGTNTAKEWKRYKLAYFTQLKARRDAVIAWAAAQPSKPKVVFIGLQHHAMSGHNPPELKALIAKAQTRALALTLSEADPMSIITTEQAGTNDRLTPRTYGELTRAQIVEMGHKISEADLKKMLATNDQAAVRIIVDHPELTVYCGEEWTLDFEAGFLMRGPTPDAQRNTAIEQLMKQLDRLRSETILIRTLEYMRKDKATKGIILQGDAHLQDLQRVKNEYKIDFTAHALNA